MKLKLTLLSLLMAMFVFSGCADKAADTPAEEPTADEVTEETTEEATEEVVTDAVQEANKVFFEFDRYDVTEDMVENIKGAAVVVSNATSIVLEGNCDERGSDEYNQALGLKRAKSVLDALVAEGADASKITTVSFGEGNPTCEELTEDCYAQNRRVEVKVK